MVISSVSDIGYYQQIQGGIFGQPDGGNSDPVSRAALQEAAAQANILCAETAGSVPQCYERLGTGNPATIGWTAQKDTGAAFPPYTAQDTGFTPDWTADANPVGAGAYDMNPAVVAAPYTALNQAPIGEAFFDGAMGVPPNPNVPAYDVGGSAGDDLEY
jgi:hypothetical protein